LGITPGDAPGPQVLIVAMGQVTKAESLRIAAELRGAGIRTEAYFGKKRGMGQQLSHADRCGIPLAIVVGEDEIAKGEVSVKDLLAGKEKRADIEDREAYRKAGRVSQVTVSREKMVGTVKQMLDVVGESDA
jgi:histidyl-tRNA synthetase